VDENVGDHQCGFDVIHQLLIRYSTFVRYWRKSGNGPIHVIYRFPEGL
jgi:hypothetical protein